MHPTDDATTPKPDWPLLTFKLALAIPAHEGRLPWLEGLVASFQSAVLGSCKGLESRPVKDLSKAVK
jgi:hypothetical protein